MNNIIYLRTLLLDDNFNELYHVTGKFVMQSKMPNLIKCHEDVESMNIKFAIMSSTKPTMNDCK